MQKTKIIGKWSIENGKVVQSEECLQIQELISTKLDQVADRESGWIKLFKNPATGEYWELDYPQSELHGGGPPTLEKLSVDEVKTRYGRLLKGEKL